MVHLVLDGGRQATINVVEPISSCIYVSWFVLTPFSTSFILSFIRLDTIGCIAFDHDFSSVDEAEINRVWQNHTNKVKDCRHSGELAKGSVRTVQLANMSGSWLLLSHLSIPVLLSVWPPWTIPIGYTQSILAWCLIPRIPCSSHTNTRVSLSLASLPPLFSELSLTLSSFWLQSFRLRVWQRQL